MPKYVIEREIPGAGNMSPQELQAASQKSCSVLQKLGAQLLGQELIGIANIDQKIRKARAILDQRDSVMSAPGGARFTEIPAQRLDPPWHLRWGGDR